jgi:acetate kinase
MSNVTESYMLVFNAGSSSLKFEVFAQRPELRSRLRGAIRDIGRAHSVFEIENSDRKQNFSVLTHIEGASLILNKIFDNTSDNPLSIDRVAATGHRVVHGGERFSVPTLVTSEVLDQLRLLGHLAPLHNPPAIAVMEVVRERFARLPMVAVFDTGFFRKLPNYARRYAIPSSWYQDHGIQRFGFHGIAHEFLYERLKTLHVRTGRVERVVSLHLGQGCSATALRNGCPVETSMGFTPVEGLIMGTRVGDLDAGAVLHMARQGLSREELEGALNRESGLLGLSGVSDDVRELLELEEAGHPDATLALSAFCHRIRKYLGAYAAVLGGLDTILFGGGIGENSARIRARICAGFEWLGLELDDEANSRCIGCEGRISTADSAVEVRVIPVREEEAIARAIPTCLDSAPTSETARFDIRG